MKIAVYPGSFDPCTNGHFDVIKRARDMFDTLIVAVLTNNSKNALFSSVERMNMLREATKEFDNVEIAAFSGLLADFTRQTGAKYIVKGLRAVSDFEYEFQMAITNKELNNEAETLFIPASPAYMFLSSSIVKEVGRYGGDIDKFVPLSIADIIKKRFAEM